MNLLYSNNLKKVSNYDRTIPFAPRFISPGTPAYFNTANSDVMICQGTHQIQKYDVFFK